MQTKTQKQFQTNDYIYSLALQLKTKLENEDILLLINHALSIEEKEDLKRQLLHMKLEVKHPVDYQVNRRIYRSIARIMDKTALEDKRQKAQRQNLIEQSKNITI